MVYFVIYLLVSWCIKLYIGTELCWYLLVSWSMCVQIFVLLVSTGKVYVGERPLLVHVLTCKLVYIETDL